VFGFIGVVGGARILAPDTIGRFRHGILNIHPGLIPENRGLSNIARAMRDGFRQAVTAHLIDGRVDAGAKVMEKVVDEHDGDTIYDLAERVMDAQVSILVQSVRYAMNGMSAETFGDLPPPPPPIHADDEWAIIDKHYGRIHRR
jgi:phosphoribosylglycinamide formyltransferase-1